MDRNTVKIVFILPSDCEAKEETSAEMQQAFEACKQNNINTDWVYEKDSAHLGLKKTDILVFQSFIGESFEKVTNSKCVRVVGPWCLLTCLTEGRQIPNFPWPLYSVAMSGCTITCSSLPKSERKQVQDKIQFMGGYVSLSLMGSCTHLVTDSVKSEKYFKAAESGIKLMLSSWVQRVWEESTKANVHCDDEKFNKYRCKPFHKLIVCCTGLNNSQRNDLKQMVVVNGGEYKENLHVNKTDIVVCESGTVSAKYKAAKKHKIKCVTIRWVTDSIKNGYAMPDTLYPVKVGTSTPTKDAEDAQPNFSMISNIASGSMLCPPNRSHFSDTIEGTEISKLPGMTPVKSSNALKRKIDSNEHNDLVDGINLKQVKMAGPFLDGCGIYLTGFGAEQREKLCKVLNFSGATRYDDISERVTHVIVGDPSCHDLKVLHSRGILKNCSLVSVEWVLASIKMQSPVDEEGYIICNVQNVAHEPRSPLSKKGLHLLRTNSNTSMVEKTSQIPTSPFEAAEIDIVKQYLRPNSSTQEDTLAKLLQNEDQSESNHNKSLKLDDERDKHVTLRRSPNPCMSAKEASLSSAVDDDSSQQTAAIFEGLKFIIVGFIEEQQHQVRGAIEAMAGKVVSKYFKGVPDYAVVPVFSPEIKQVAAEVVNDLWITECWQENEIRPVEYFHQPISVREDALPLKDCVVTISSYTNYERNFLKNLIIQLGGVSQELFSRTTSAKTGLLANTHLVSPEAAGKKYTAAIKWGLPVLNKDWLLECARTLQYAPQTPFLVGDAKCSTKQDEIPLAKESTSTRSLSKTNSPFPTKASSSKASAFLSENNTSNAPSRVALEDVQISKPNTPVCEKLQISRAEHTPVNKLLRNVDNSSGGVCSQITPVQQITAEVRTPVNKLLRTVLNSSGGVCSQITPVQKIIAEARMQNLLNTPDGNRSFLKSWDHVDTPETPLGAFINPNPSPNLRKQMVRFLNTLPEWKPRPPRRESTPLSELKRRLWDKICPPKHGPSQKPEQPDFDSIDDEVFLKCEESADNVSTPQKNVPESIVNNQLQQLQEMLTSSGGNRSNSRVQRQSMVPVVATEVKDSQPNTVGWDECMECEEAQKPQSIGPVFMFSGIEQDQRELMIVQLENLGVKVLNLANFDPVSTHLLCPKPSRNEKILACMAAGKWILHPSYVDECVAKGRLVDEEHFEFGNPKSRENVHMQAEKENEARMTAMHYWRKENARRGYGAFHDMRVIVIAQKKDPLIRVIQAGGGMVVEASPPFTQPVHATHCLLDAKLLTNVSDYVCLAKQGIYCVNTLYVNDFLQRTASDVRDYILPKLAEYYESK